MSFELPQNATKSRVEARCHYPKPLENENPGKTPHPVYLVESAKRIKQKEDTRKNAEKDMGRSIYYNNNHNTRQTPFP